MSYQSWDAAGMCDEFAFVWRGFSRSNGGIWRVTVSGDHGFDLSDDLPDILLFARPAAEAAILICWVVS